MKKEKERCVDATRAFTKGPLSFIHETGAFYLYDIINANKNSRVLRTKEGMYCASKYMLLTIKQHAS